MLEARFNSRRDAVRLKTHRSVIVMANRSVQNRDLRLQLVRLFGADLRGEPDASIRQHADYPVMCSAGQPQLHLKAYELGADGVMVAG